MSQKQQTPSSSQQKLQNNQIGERSQSSTTNLDLGKQSQNNIQGLNNLNGYATLKIASSGQLNNLQLNIPHGSPNEQSRDSLMTGGNFSSVGGLQQAIGLGLAGHKLHKIQDLNNQLYNDDINLEDVFESNPNWFAFETRVRKMVLAMIEPQVKRSIQERETVQEIKKQHDIIKRKIDECEFIIHKAQKKTASQEDVHKKIEFNETKQKIYEVKIKEAIDKLQHLQDVMAEKVDIVEQERSSFIMRVENLSYEQKKLREELISIKENLTSIIEKTHLELKKSIATFNNQIEYVAADIQLEKKKIVIQSNDFKKFGHTIEINNRRLLEIEELLSKALNEKLESSKFTQKITHIEKEIKMTQENSFKIELSVRDAYSYIDKYIPMHTQLQIDETLHSTLIKKASLLKSLYEFEKQKFKQLDEKIKGLPSHTGPGSVFSATQSTGLLPHVNPNTNQQSQQFIVSSPKNSQHANFQAFENGSSPLIISKQILSQSPQLVKQGSSNATGPNTSQQFGPQNQQIQHLLLGNHQHSHSYQQNDRRHYILPNFQVRELELQRSKNHKHKKGDRLRGIGGGGGNNNSKQALQGVRILASESSQGNINTFQRSESSISKISKIKIKAGSKNARTKKRTRPQNIQIAQSYDSQTDTNKLQVIGSQQSQNSKSQLNKNLPVKVVQQQTQLKIELEPEDITLKPSSSQRNLTSKHRSGMSLDNQNKSYHIPLLIQQQIDQVNAKMQNFEQNLQNIATVQTTVNLQQNQALAMQLVKSDQSQSKQSDNQSIHQIIELSEESMAESASKSVQKRVKNLQQLKIDENLSNLPKIDEVAASNMLLEEDTPTSKNQMGTILNQNRTASDRRQLRADGSGQSDLQYTELKNQATLDFSKVNPLAEGSIEQTMQNYLIKQAIVGPDEEDVSNQSQDRQFIINPNNKQVYSQSEQDQEDEEEEEEDEEEEDEEEDDDDDDDYDSDDSSNPGFELTPSMIERLQRTEVREIDLEQTLQAKFQQFNDQIHDLRSRFPQEANYQNIQDQFEETSKLIESVKSGVRVLAESIQQQFKSLGQQMQDERDFQQNEMAITEKKRRRDMFEVLQKIEDQRSYLKNVEGQVRILEGEDNFYKNICLQLIEVAKVDNALMQADEVDRKSIALMGIKEDQATTSQLQTQIGSSRPLSPIQSHNDLSSQQNNLNQSNTKSPTNNSHIRMQNIRQNQVVTIDKSCLSCSTQSYKVISAFKMACLTYFPSAVRFQGNEYTRENLISIKSSLLDQLLILIADNQRKQEDLDQKIRESKVNQSGIGVRQSHNSSLTSKEDKILKLSYQYDNHITVAIDNKVPILSNINTVELLSGNSGTISQEVAHLDRRIITIGDSERDSKQVVQSFGLNERNKSNFSPSRLLNQSMSQIQQKERKQITNSNDKIKSKSKQVKQRTGSLPPKLSPYKNDSLRNINHDNIPKFDKDNKNDDQNDQERPTSNQSQKDQQYSKRRRESVKIQNIRQKTEQLWSDHHRYPQFNQNYQVFTPTNNQLNSSSIITSPSNSHSYLKNFSNKLNKTHVNSNQKIKFEDSQFNNNNNKNTNGSQSVLLNPLIDEKKYLNKTMRIGNQSTTQQSSNNNYSKNLNNPIFNQILSPQINSSSIKNTNHVGDYSHTHLGGARKKKSSGLTQNQIENTDNSIMSATGYGESGIQTRLTSNISSAPISPSKTNGTVTPSGGMINNKRNQQMQAQLLRQANNSSVNYGLNTNTTNVSQNQYTVPSRLQ